MTIQTEAIYLGDNGRAYCGDHLGYTAQTTGRDLSGQPIYKVQPEDVQEAARMGVTLKCEECGKAASSIHLPA